MPKNFRGGSAFKRKKKINETVVRNFPIIQDMTTSNEVFSYAKVIDILGGRNVLLEMFYLGKFIKKIGIICGSMYKKIYLQKNNIILCSHRICVVNDKCDILFKYNDQEVKQLILPQQFINNKECFERETNYIEFVNIDYI